jgi:S1-C subfamily serine protease
VAGTLAGAWYLGLTFKDSPSTALNRQINDSTILRTLDAMAPRPPAFLASLQKLFNSSGFPNPFATIAPEILPPVPTPSTVDTLGVRQARALVAKVLSHGCALEAGSSWPVAPDYLITNAHVVAGGQSIQVQTPDGVTRDATVVLFDPDIDVAILHVPGLGLGPLTIAAADPIRGTVGAVIGFPGGGAQRVAAGGVRGTENAQGRNIYGDGLVTRRIMVLNGAPPPGEGSFVIPGDSGGPMVNLNGVVIGLVFAASTLDPNEGYALTPSQINADITRGVGQVRAVSTQDCTT